MYSAYKNKRRAYKSIDKNTEIFQHIRKYTTREHNKYKIYTEWTWAVFPRAHDTRHVPSLQIILQIFDTLTGNIFIMGAVTADFPRAKARNAPPQFVCDI